MDRRGYGVGVAAAGVAQLQDQLGAAVEAVGLHVGVDMTRWWSADDAFFSILRDRDVLLHIVADVAGQSVADANRGEKTKTLKQIVRDHLDGTNGRTKREQWVPRWMTFPPAAYTARGGVGTVAAHAIAQADHPIDRQAPGDDEPDPTTPGAVRDLPVAAQAAPPLNEEGEADRLAA